MRVCVLSDLLPGVPEFVQLYHTGEDGALAISARVDRHLLHHHSWSGEGATGEKIHRHAPLVFYLVVMDQNFFTFSNGIMSSRLNMVSDSDV